MPFEKGGRTPSLVAPLAGSVDRNDEDGNKRKDRPVAPLAGSVDRNGSSCQILLADIGRSPCGERG